MAKKIVLIRYLEEVRAHAYVTNRRPQPALPFFIMPLHLCRTKTLPVTRPRMWALNATWQNGPEVAIPVRINHHGP